MSAAEARRRMKADLQAQLDRINAAEEEERLAQEAQQREIQTQREHQASRHAAHQSAAHSQNQGHGHRIWEQQEHPYSQSSSSTSSYRPARTDTITPTWPHSQQQQQRGRDKWGSDANGNRNGHGAGQGQGSSHAHNDRQGGSSRHTDTESTFRAMPDPTPMFGTSGPSVSAPGPRPWHSDYGNGSTASSSSRAAIPETYPPASTTATESVSTMPNPFSGSFVNTPVPSSKQLHEYLVNKRKLPLGLGMGWSVEGSVFDVYDLFVAVIRLGGGATVTRRGWWPYLAGMLGIPSHHTQQGLRASPEASRQLSAFYQLHLATLEKMWEETRPASGPLGEGSTVAGDRSGGSRVRQPVSATRGVVAEDSSRAAASRPSSTYPPPPPEHRESSTSTQHYGRSRPDGSLYAPTSPSSRIASMPLQLNHSESGTAFPLSQPPQRKKQSTTAKPRQPTSGASNAAPTSSSRPQAGVSPVLSHPGLSRPAQPQSSAPEVSQQRTTIDPNFFAPHPRSSPTVATAPKSSQPALPPTPLSAVNQEASQPPLSGGSAFAPLTNYHPPKFASFDHLVATNALTLPTPPPNVQLNFTGSEAEVYAKRCFELRGVIKKIQAKEPTRKVSKDELTFWQKLLAILRHNPTVVIPGSQPMSTDNAPVVSLPYAPNQGSQAEGGPSNTNGAVPGAPVTKKRGRPRKSTVDEHGNPIEKPKRKRGRPSKADYAAAEAAASAAGQVLPSASTNPSSGAALPISGPEAPSSRATTSQTVPVSTAPNSIATATGGSSQVAAAALAALAGPAGSQASVGADQAIAGGSLPPKARKPYTIRRHPDGTPVAGRFRKSLPGNVGPSPIGNGSQGAPIDFTAGMGVPAPETLADYYERDAIGEIDPDSQQPAAGPSGSQPTLPIAQALSQIAPDSGSVSDGGTPGLKTKNPKLSESMKRLWEKRRRERSFAMLSGQLAESAASNPAFGAPGPAGPSNLVAIAPASQPRGNGTGAGVVGGHGGFSFAGNASRAAQKRWAEANKKNGKSSKITAKRWSLQHAALAARRDEDEPLSQGYRATSASVSPAVMSTPRRVIALSDRPDREREGTPSRIMSTDSLRQRAGSLKPRSSLPMHLTPAPKRDWSPVQSQDHEYAHEHEYEPVSEDDTASHGGSQRTTRGAAQTNSQAKGKGKGKSLLANKGPRSSPPSNLGNRRGSHDMGPPLSTERLTRADKGKGVDRGAGTVAQEPLARLILTRGDKARNAMDPRSTRLLSRRSLPSMRASSVQPTPRRTIADISSRAPRESQPSSSQSQRARLVPEVEIFVPRRQSLSLSQPTPTRVQRPRSPPVSAPKRIHRPTTKIKPTFKTKPRAKYYPKPEPKRASALRRHVQVIIPIRRRRRAQLIAAGSYDPFRDDDSDDEEVVKRSGHAGLRQKVALPRGSKARTARPQEPDVIPLRFITMPSGAPHELELNEPHKSALAEETILKRLYEHECGWKGCDSVLASEWHLRRHVDLRRHAAQGHFKAGIYGEQTLYRCHWEDCDQPCFASMAGLEQHLTSRHISRNLSCPFPECGLTYSTLSHLTRHALKHHDSPSDLPVALADLSEHVPPPPMPDPPQPLPETVRTDMLTTPSISGSTFRSAFRVEWCRLKVKNGSFAPDEPILHIEHPPHILHRIDDSDDEDDASDVGTVYTTLEGGLMTEERLLDESYGRPKRRLIPTVDIRVRKRSREGSAGDISPGPEVDAEVQQHEDFIEIDADTDADADLGEVDDDLPLGAPTPYVDAETNDLPFGAPTPYVDAEDLDLDLDLGEANEFEDPIQEEEAFAPVLGPTPGDILFDLSDESSNGDGGEGAQTPASEAEVWAELEDVEMNEAFTPAGMLGDYEMSEDGDGDDDGSEGTQPVLGQGLDLEENEDNAPAPEDSDSGVVEADTDAIIEAIFQTGNDSRAEDEVAPNPEPVEPSGDAASGPSDEGIIAGPADGTTITSTAEDVSTKVDLASPPPDKPVSVQSDHEDELVVPPAGTSSEDQESDGAAPDGTPADERIAPIPSETLNETSTAPTSANAIEVASTSVQSDHSDQVVETGSAEPETVIEMTTVVEAADVEEPSSLPIDASGDAAALAEPIDSSTPADAAPSLGSRETTPAPSALLVDDDVNELGTNSAVAQSEEAPGPVDEGLVNGGLPDSSTADTVGLAPEQISDQVVDVVDSPGGVVIEEPVSNADDQSADKPASNADDQSTELVDMGAVEAPESDTILVEAESSKEAGAPQDAMTGPDEGIPSSSVGIDLA